MTHYSVQHLPRDSVPVLTLLRILLFAVLVCAAPALHAVDKVRLQLRFDHQFQFAGYYAAQWQGYYSESGLEVEILPGVREDRSMITATDAVRDGVAEFGIGAGDILLAIDQGTSLKVVASIFQQNPVELFARADVQLNSPADLHHLRILEEPNPLVRAVIAAMLHAEGIAPASVNFIPFDQKLPVTDRIEALLTGEIDVLPGDVLAVDIMPGYSLSIPWYANERGVRLTSLKPAAYGVDFYGDSLFTTAALVESDPDLVERFRDASIKGWQYAMTHPDEVIKRIVDELPRRLPVTDLTSYNNFLAGEVRSLMNYPSIQIGHVNPQRWHFMHEALLAAGAVNTPLLEPDYIFDPVQLRHQRTQTLLTYALETTLAAILVLILLSMIYLSRAKRRAEENERRYKALFDDSPVSIWEEDFSATKRYLDEQLATTGLSTRELLDSRPDIIAECARRVLILDVNRATLTLHKASSKADLVSNLPNIFTDESFMAFRDELICLAEGQTEFQTEAIVKSIAGDKIHIDLRLSVLPSSRKNWERIVILITDISERKKAEELLNKYRLMISTTADMMAYISKEYRYLAVNDAYRKAFRMDNDSLIGMHVDEVFGTEIFEQNLKPKIDACLAGEQISFELALPFPGIGHRFLNINYYPTRDDSGTVEGFVSHIHDRTETKILENELLESRDNLERRVLDRTHKLTHALHELKAFSYAVSHDLRAPLRAINGFSSALIEDYSTKLDATARDFLHRINRNTLKMAEQIDGMLALSRISRSDLNYTTVNVSAIATELVEQYLTLHPEPPTQVSIQPGILAYGDSRMLEIALDNLINNAFKFSRDVASPSIEIGSSEQNGAGIIYIKDNGIGFDMQYADRLFTVFQRLHVAYEGTGIGLATVQRVIMRHGGEVWAESAPGQGATFYIRLPSESQVAALELHGDW